MTAINTYEEMFSPLSAFLSNLNVSLFFLIIYDQVYSDICNKGKLIYERTPEKEFFDFTNAREIVIEDFFKELGSHSGSSRIWCMKYLRSGSEYLGLVIYEAQDLIHPQLCNGLILLANTVKRLFGDRERMDRSVQLEQDVTFRTRDLLEANKKLREEVDRRMKVEAEVFRISEMERRRFSMDLYDEICRQLKELSVTSKSAAAEKGFFKRNAAMKGLSAQIDETFLKIRRYAHTSFPTELILMGLRKSLETLCSETTNQTRSECKLSWAAGDKSPLSQNQDIYVYWIIQEAIQNTIKHTKAKRITVDINSDDSNFAASVHNNGKGNPLLNTGNSPLNENGKEGLGIRSMRYWAKQAAAEFSIISQEPGGTTVRIRINISAKT